MPGDNQTVASIPGNDSATVVQITHHGGADELRLAMIDLPPPGPNELRVRQTAIGVNYHDVYVRSGLYRTLPLPGIPGIEAVGVVEALGADVQGYAIGDRIGYVYAAYGGYASARNLPAALAIKLPAALPDVYAAASLMKALTVYVLIHRAYVVKNGDTILVQAAAGGVGQLLCRWAHHLGANVIGTVGSLEKADIARRAGADHVIQYRQEDLVARVHEITRGEGVSAAYDSVGQDTLLKSLDCLAFEGALVTYGQSSGPVNEIVLSQLATRSLTLVRPIIFHYLRSEQRMRSVAAAVLAAFDDGVIVPITPLVLPLADAAEAHRILEARASPGGIVLAPPARGQLK